MNTQLVLAYQYEYEEIPTFKPYILENNNNQLNNSIKSRENREIYIPLIKAIITANGRIWNADGPRCQKDYKEIYLPEKLIELIVETAHLKFEAKKKKEELSADLRDLWQKI